jgi:hypothetical protein
MAAENIGTIYPTKIPGLADPADIQAALRLYHYGTSETITTENQIVPESVVGHIKSLDTRVDTIETGIQFDGLGSSVLSTKPTSVHNGYIWVDSSSSVTSLNQYTTARYQTSAPSDPVTGTLWVDSDSSPLKLYVWSGFAWREIGS